MEKFNYLEFLSKECKTEIATADFVSQLMMNKVYEKGFKDACLSSEVIPISVLEDIKVEMENLKDNRCFCHHYERGINECINVLNKHMESEYKE